MSVHERGGGIGGDRAELVATNVAALAHAGGPGIALQPAGSGRLLGWRLVVREGFGEPLLGQLVVCYGEHHDRDAAEQLVVTSVQRGRDLDSQLDRH